MSLYRKENYPYMTKYFNTMERQLNSKTRAELATEYGITRKTLYNWLKRAKIKLQPGRISPKKLKEIYNYFGEPKR